ncbi:transcriptional regulator, IclR family [Beijerinckia sp. 28-YEA-48]|nr:transcriptional regulator, IclR family [Beijerinckia sp. 28-YEA-48]
MMVQIPDEEGEDDRYMVPALVRGLQILQWLSIEGEPRTLVEIANGIGQTRSAAYRAVYTLEKLGYLGSDSDGRKMIVKDLPRRSAGTLDFDLAEMALPILRDLRDESGWSAHLGVLSDFDVVYLARVPTHRPVASTIVVGARLPAFSTTMGRVLLAGLSQAEVTSRFQAAMAKGELTPHAVLADILKQMEADKLLGFVSQISSFEAGIASVAAPIVDASGRTVASINMSGAALHVGREQIDRLYKGQVIAAADRISAAIAQTFPSGPSANRLSQKERLAK